MRDPFDAFMTTLPLWLPAVIVGAFLQWLIIRGAVLSALRRHSWDERNTPDKPAADPSAPSGTE
ncbi:hypothetical protein SCB71_04800 [Herbiconiux sp. KACC 21604]|uniref:hypothetical protein n=1 Tax=unclassified Herbiconiux TaxID=2618217 RepID=UPI0014910990|nr:hypothetical protein [Herbiconiux sp. SALV-R1]QJU52670.1 hypothetical protein HL652_02775 [Herbiconiux sp. SALV-R1]WPO87566.1 hypothetical protein SCB71_04800 [Herbiconiux sp. KACC 21604]